VKRGNIALLFSQTFDKIWHDILLYKIQQHLPEKFHAILKSYLSEKYFFIKQHDVVTEIREMRSGILQGNVLGSFPYFL